MAPSELVQLALDTGLTALGVTDHDSTEAVMAAVAAAEATPLTVVPGVELSTDVPTGEVHVLGYFVDPEGAVLQARLAELREGRLRRGQQIVERLNAAGVPVSLERVMAFAGEGSVGRPHVARALVEAGLAVSTSDAFDRFLVRGRPGYVERARFTPVEAVRTILAAGGVPVLAHPLHGVADDSDVQALVAARVGELVEAGLHGLEVYYDGYDDAAVRYLAGLAHQHGLIATGGSDFHGPGRTPLGAVRMPEHVQTTVVDDLRAAACSSVPG
jgi:predicted metal-dependent phosphoesterase TrpH